MAKKFDAKMFDKIKDVLSKPRSTGGSYANIMKFPAGHSYKVRLIPNLDNIDDTVYEHYIHQWESKADGSFVSALSLTTLNEKDPIATLRWKLFKEWKKANPNPPKDVKYKGPIDQKQQWFFNIYIVEDPSNPENNGTVKILKAGPQLKKIIDEHLSGERSEEFGTAIFDLSKDGFDFVIKAEQQGEYTTFIKSYFKSSSIDLTDEEQDEIYTKVHDLKSVHPVKSYDELQQLLSDHYYCGEVPEEPVKEARKPLSKQQSSGNGKPASSTPKNEPDFSDVGDDEDDIPFDFEDNSGSDSEDMDVDDLLAGLDN